MGVLTPEQNALPDTLCLLIDRVFEVPSNILLKTVAPSKWIAFLMLGWGVITMGLGGAQSYGAVAGVRFLLGTFEAGMRIQVYHVKMVRTSSNLFNRVVSWPCLLLK